MTTFQHPCSQTYKGNDRFALVKKVYCDLLVSHALEFIVTGAMNKQSKIAEFWVSEDFKVKSLSSYFVLLHLIQYK